jgi:hypothetical protein
MRDGLIQAAFELAGREGSLLDSRRPSNPTGVEAPALGDWERGMNGRADVHHISRRPVRSRIAWVRLSLPYRGLPCNIAVWVKRAYDSTAVSTLHAARSEHLSLRKQHGVLGRDRAGSSRSGELPTPVAGSRLPRCKEQPCHLLQAGSRYIPLVS